MEAGRIVQVNISPGGLPKTEIPEAEAGTLGLAGDHHNHPEFHGGPEKALLLVSLAAIEELRQRGWPLYPGALGENLTVDGLDFRQLQSGLMFRAGPAVIELTTLRKPCRLLDAYNIEAAPGRIQDAVRGNGYGGWYARVLEGGLIRKGDPIRLMQARV